MVDSSPFQLDKKRREKPWQHRVLRTVGTCQKTVSLSLVDDLEGDDEVPSSHDTTGS